MEVISAEPLTIILRRKCYYPAYNECCSIAKLRTVCEIPGDCVCLFSLFVYRGGCQPIEIYTFIVISDDNPTICPSNNLKLNYQWLCAKHMLIKIYSKVYFQKFTGIWQKILSAFQATMLCCAWIGDHTYCLYEAYFVVYSIETES